MTFYIMFFSPLFADIRVISWQCRSPFFCMLKIYQPIALEIKVTGIIKNFAKRKDLTYYQKNGIKKTTHVCKS